MPTHNRKLSQHGCDTPTWTNCVDCDMRAPLAGENRSDMIEADLRSIVSTLRDTTTSCAVVQQREFYRIGKCNATGDAYAIIHKPSCTVLTSSRNVQKQFRRFRARTLAISDQSTFGELCKETNTQQAHTQTSTQNTITHAHKHTHRRMRSSFSINFRHLHKILYTKLPDAHAQAKYRPLHVPHTKSTRKHTRKSKQNAQR